MRVRERQFDVCGEAIRVRQAPIRVRIASIPLHVLEFELCAKTFAFETLAITPYVSSLRLSAEWRRECPCPELLGRREEQEMSRFERSGALDMRWKSTISICLTALAVTAALTGGEAESRIAGVQMGGQAESRRGGGVLANDLRLSVSPPLRPFSKAISFAILEDYDKGTP